MKVSKLITEIVELAEAEFGHIEHSNDCIAVGIYVDTSDPDDVTYQAWLQRPTKANLLRGEAVSINSIKSEECLHALTQESDTLVSALKDLKDAVLAYPYGEALDYFCANEDL